MSDGFTKEELESMIENGGHGESYTYGYVKAMADQLVAEMDTPGVWDGAPDVANECTVYFARRDGKISDSFRTNKTYTRTLPKTKARQIAEKWADTPTQNPTRPYLADIIEAAILEAQEGAK